MLFEVNENPSLDLSFSSPLAVAPYANWSLFCVSLQQNRHVSPKHIPLWNLIANLSKFLAFSFSDEAWLTSRLDLSKAGGRSKPWPCKPVEVPITDSYYHPEGGGTAHLGNSQEEQASDRDLLKIRHNANECRPLDSRRLSGSQTGKSWPSLKWNNKHLLK